MASVQSKQSLASLLKKKQSLASAVPKNLPASFLRQITNDFSAEQELCRSVFGIVYQGILPDGSLIAVKRLTENSPVPPSEVFETEVANLMKLQHKNIVELVGSCLEAQKRLVEHKGRFVFEEVVVSCLCYKYPPKGSLEKHFNADTRSFDWETRFEIIMGICEGLLFLHKALDKPIIHMNLVPNSIWLDDNGVPKIAVFCHSRLFGQEAILHTINAKENIGYMAPECEISTMSDIYSLGMLILEITTGEKNCPDAEDRSARRYVENVHQLWMANEIKCNYPLLDSNHLQHVKACIEIGLKCVEADRNKRPSIVDIVGKLHRKCVPILGQSGARFQYKWAYKSVSSSVFRDREMKAIELLSEKKANTAELIGIEEAVNGLMNIITDGNELSMEQGKIVSIVGLGGLGKTTLAHAIYQKLRAQYNCYAFVSVSRNPDMKKLFKCMLYQLGKKSNANIHESILDERLLVYELIEFLQKRRYFIVVDDIWDISVWKMIRCALPTNNGGYIIITTTRIFDVAKQVGGAYYKMPNLCIQNSRVLFNRRIFGIKDTDKYELIILSERILHECGGVPLAIIMISGLLATKGGKKNEWYKVYNSIGTTIKDSLYDENMKRILSLSYDDLPSHLRTCLLYLSVFPAGYEIGKDRLIRIWIAEDLIQCEKQGESLFEIGERYFYELIDRGMIQPVYKRWYYDMTENCRVHDMVFELICYLSCKENFVSILDHVHHTFPSKEIIQRLSLQNCMVDHATHRATMSMQEVRSVVVFPSAVNILPALASFRVLRVLDLQSCCLSQGYSLKYLENLVDLRYLGLRDTGISQLSREIGKLQFLQTLDVTAGQELQAGLGASHHLKSCQHYASKTPLIL
ncbi:disease resistance protein RGA5 isoform X2 [Setaria viridis]|uniref:Protein kinase domain-containing protein n=1 Tax=Setaria viridis TaxID=4556 RepID=A0A4V6D3A7_SETVI|nr:disease resistance protein RGA5-like isoform X2 [Setaria viridis]TKW01888.1 hypothetical protein SEVIR_8G208500v2 [Setaria viridis]TKW01889.1 hypothetical protein SEVIR_8G208500v2 [Setaria viridis]TKW01890.1 hypothetical protein SEVIR_8G208500v2 [Setaria viridis]TKW01891.1 hypothetical protein SEVIR_8G208500v2 [Setaria viridis]TKW01895.1 hypothetical protein SEVIR_8G208500v2 [Setaria viridis]